MIHLIHPTPQTEYRKEDAELLALLTEPRSIRQLATAIKCSIGVIQNRVQRLIKAQIVIQILPTA
jgi:predicted transcriptional regulator